MENEISKAVQRQIETRQNACRCKLHPPLGNWHLVFPRNFRERRALLIAAWFLPDWLKFEILVSLEGKKVENLDFKSKGLENSIQLESFSQNQISTLLLLEKEVFFSKRVLFGTILAEDLRSALSFLKIVEEFPRKPKIPVRRKGYNDKGTWSRPDRQRRFGNDFILLKEQENIEKKRLLIKLFSKILLLKLQEENL